jgi:6,7-dimethyl-8-ribityllumazine synthase
MQQAKTGSVSVFDASDWNIGIVLAEFNSDITSKLYESAIKRAKDYKIEDSNIQTIRVAGAAELPMALKYLAQTGKYRALLAIGCVIRGATPHFDYICKIATEGILAVQLETMVPIGFGLLTCDNEAQALERVNLGKDHLDAAMQLANLVA